MGKKTKVKDAEGNIYPSIKAAAKALGWGETYVRTRVKNKEPLYPYDSLGDDEKRNARRSPIVIKDVNGREYPSVREASRRLGWSRKIILAKAEAGELISPKPNKPKGREAQGSAKAIHDVYGNTHRSIKSAAIELGWPVASFRAHLANGGEAFRRDDLNYSSEAPPEKTKGYVDVYGGVHNSLREAANALCWESRERLRGFLAMGGRVCRRHDPEFDFYEKVLSIINSVRKQAMQYEKTASRKIRKDSIPLVDAYGVEHLSVAMAADILRLQRGNIRARLSSGKPIYHRDDPRIKIRKIQLVFVDEFGNKYLTAEDASKALGWRVATIREFASRSEKIPHRTTIKNGRPPTKVLDVYGVEHPSLVIASNILGWNRGWISRRLKEGKPIFRKGDPDYDSKIER